MAAGEERSTRLLFKCYRWKLDVRVNPSDNKLPCVSGQKANKCPQGEVFDLFRNLIYLSTFLLILIQLAGAMCHRESYILPSPGAEKVPNLERGTSEGARGGWPWCGLCAAEVWRTSRAAAVATTISLDSDGEHRPLPRSGLHRVHWKKQPLPWGPDSLKSQSKERGPQGQSDIYRARPWHRWEQSTQHPTESGEPSADGA